jgi:hypothetical protein
MPELTRDERAVLLHYAKEPRGILDTVTANAVYVVPSLVFAIYGTVKGDFSAVSLAYFVLLLTVIVGINYQSRRSVGFRLILVKCLHRLAELEGAAAPDERANR